ncbi:MAG: hypothetical protein IJO91_01565 [Oscillospiraceae bacterium]|nr:hypothetical protein [Oscillospiraceae bacterium]
MNTFAKAEHFICRNARPLDLALWRFYFRNGSADDVLSALSFYQNEDGGFGHGLEPDYLNPNSSPIQTWQATEIILETGVKDSSHPVIQGILRYLDSGADFDTAHNQWLNCVPPHTDYPHAIWWEYNENGELKYNPTAALAGFILRFADSSSELYEKGCTIARQAAEWFISAEPFEEMHVKACFVRLYEALCKTNAQIADMERFKECLIRQVNSEICHDISKYGKEYVPLPSNFIHSPDSLFYAGNEELIAAECRLITEGQLPDGSYPVPWQWWTDYSEFHVSANHWKSIIITNNMRFLKAFGGI